MRNLKSRTYIIDLFKNRFKSLYLTDSYINSSIHDCQTILLPEVPDISGNLTAINSNQDIPFGIKRIYYIYSIPQGSKRGGHAHISLKEIIIAINGSFDVVIDDGKIKKNINLRRPDTGLFIPNGIWRELTNFIPQTVCLVIASQHFDEMDYIRTYGDFLKSKSI